MKKSRVMTSRPATRGATGATTDWGSAAATDGPRGTGAPDNAATNSSRVFSFDAALPSRSRASAIRARRGSCENFSTQITSH